MTVVRKVIARRTKYGRILSPSMAFCPYRPCNTISPASFGDARRCFSSEDGGSSTNKAFDRPFKVIQRDNAARAHNRWDPSDRVTYDYFRQEIAHRLVDRLDDIKREDGFPLALDIGSGPGYIHRAICKADAIEGVGGIGGVRKLVQLESSKEMLHRDDDIPVEGGERCDTYRLEGDEEGELPFPDGTFDLVISSCALHWVNNLPGLFKEVSVSYFHFQSIC